MLSVVVRSPFIFAFAVASCDQGLAALRMGTAALMSTVMLRRLCADC